MKLQTFLLKQYGIQAIIAIAIFGVMIVTSLWSPDRHKDIAWLESIFGAGTCFFAIFLWYNAIRREWIDSLPRRITVQFQYQGHNVMVCKDATLTEKSDARTWALQIGQQISKCQRLEFGPFYTFEDRGIIKEPDKNQVFRRFVFTYYLSDLPNYDLQKEPEKEAILNKMKGGCIVWSPHYNHDGSIEQRETVEPTGQKVQHNT
jgi:hypothetical protein